MPGDAVEHESHGPEPLRALLVVDDEVLSRVESMVRHLCVGLIDELVRPVVMARPGSRSTGEAVGPAKVISPPRHWWGGHPELDEGLLEQLGGKPPHVVHCLSASLARWARPLAAEARAAMVVHLLDREDVRGFTGVRGFPRLMAVAATRAVEALLLRRHPDLKDLTFVVPPGLPVPAEPACFANPERVPTAIVTTPLVQGSGLELVLRALRLVREEGLELHLFVLSDGGSESAFRRQLDRLGLRSMVTFAGAIRDFRGLCSAMASADLFIQPSEPQRYSLTLLGAMAAGMAVLAPRGTLEDYLIDDQTTALFDLDPASLAATWIALLKDRSLAKRLAGAAQDYVRIHHRPSVMVGSVATLYRRLAWPATQTHSE